MEFKTISVSGFKGYANCIRFPFKGYAKRDTDFSQEDGPDFVIGKDDYRVMTNLIKGGQEHRKGLRGIVVNVEIDAPRYWWSEADTYSTRLYESSESTMHTLRKEDFGQDQFDFDWDSAPTYMTEAMNHMIEAMKIARDDMNQAEGKDKLVLLRQLKGMLPESYRQRRGMALNYETLTYMYAQRKDHRLKEWNTDFVNWVHTLPYSEFITHEWDGVDTSSE